jgi:hypothetical protein
MVKKKAKVRLDDLFPNDGGTVNEPASTPVPKPKPNGSPVPEPKLQPAPDGYKGVRPPRFEPVPRTLAQHPKKHAPGSLEAGTSVWYRDQRFYVSWAPADWHDTSFIMISDKPVRPGSYMHRDCVSFSVPADLCELAPVRKSIFHEQDTKQAAETKAKKKELGITDIGDDVGELLRGKSVDETYAIAAKYLGAPVLELKAKYAHLNPGQQRMVLGNRMRKRK